MADDFGQHIPGSGTQFVEPGWKAICRTRDCSRCCGRCSRPSTCCPPGSMAIQQPRRWTETVRKPLFSREGANVEIFQEGERTISVNGDYGAEGHIVKRCTLPDFGGNYPMIGSWLVANQPCGICIREDVSLVTGDDAAVPHIIAGQE